ncbi:PREDICTED: uncharacterized protein LOC105148320 [Acromyrmex echinatior]|uniref:CHK kinase-like domain-containing protein n=1 Tax=Acromyrmex echinatior TaxID=103372 RepID=F4WRH2_ACREC|nr:PREDICTED: uncharacterized protein LOC105148320 [Acromyrmex echinatior]EGI63189.1 hypothetical protein G5I_08426 [Acromyrmex echinatior]
MSYDEDFQKWIKNIMSKIIESFGPNIDEARYEITESIDIFMSTIHYVCVKFKNRLTNQNEEHSIILKRPRQLEMWTQMIGSDQQFRNEILFYRIYVGSDENFPRCFYADEKPPIDSVIALENISKRGYCPCTYKYNAPLEYTLAAMREIGRFHGKGYVMKELQKEKFFDIVRQFQGTKYDNLEVKFIINSQATRAVDYLRSHNHNAAFCDKMEALLSNAFNEVINKILKPVEPLATMCHGDFTLSNMLFKRDDDGQQRAMLIDFAICSYSTPVVDLSTYISLCYRNEMMKDKFFDIMRVYHDALKDYLLEAGVWNVDKYSYDVFLDDYKRGSLFGFIIASFFLPISMGYADVNEQILEIGIIKYCRRLKHKGGDEISKILADMLLHLRDLGFLKDFL